MYFHPEIFTELMKLKQLVYECTLKKNKKRHECVMPVSQWGSEDVCPAG